ncbi:MAG: hypothetical protein M3Q65_14675 [Chloroflexota bacterium]|nr:hypothetical protein [Chloroflexota bacterium]
MGGTVRVYRALDRVLKRFVAVKLRRAEHGRDQGAVGRFYRAARRRRPRAPTPRRHLRLRTPRLRRAPVGPRA